MAESGKKKTRQEKAYPFTNSGWPGKIKENYTSTKEI
jgi:hypothetical protein